MLQFQPLLLQQLLEPLNLLDEQPVLVALLLDSHLQLPVGPLVLTYIFPEDAYLADGLCEVALESDDRLLQLILEHILIQGDGLVGS